MKTTARLFYEVDYFGDETTPIPQRSALTALMQKDDFLYYLSEDAQYKLVSKVSACLCVARLDDGSAKFYVDEEEKTIIAELLITKIDLGEGELIGLSCLDWNSKNMQVSHDENKINIRLVFPI